VYIQPRRKEPRNLIRLAALLLLLLALVEIYVIQERPKWARPFEPTPTPTRPLGV
jgi:hypothetical protein